MDSGRSPVLSQRHERDDEIVLEALGARRSDVGQGPDVNWVVMRDPDGNYFDVLPAFTPEQLATR